MGRFVGGRDTGFARGYDRRRIRTVRRNDAYRRRHGGGGRPDGLSLAPRKRLRRALLDWTDCLLRRHCGCHSAINRDDYLLDGGTAIGHCFVHRGHSTKPSYRFCRCDLRNCLRTRQSGSADIRRALACDLGCHQGGELVDRHDLRHLWRHLWRNIHADRGCRCCGRVFAIHHHGDPSRSRASRSLAHHCERSNPDLANHDDCDRGRHIRLAADDQRHS